MPTREDTARPPVAAEDAATAPALAVTSVLAAGKSLGTLGLLAAALPLNLALTGAALVRGAVVPARREQAAEPKTILISGGKMTKALALARAFHRDGHRVVLVESPKYRWTGHRFSRAVDAFHTVPSPDHPDYARRLVEIVVAEGVDVYVPVCSPLASRYDALAKAELSEHCEVLHVGADEIDRLDDKYEFAMAAASLDLPVPDSHRILSEADVSRFDFAHHDGTYILKSIAYDPVRRLDLTELPRPSAAETAEFLADLPLAPDNPWVMQRFLPGEEFCTHSTVREGRVQLHCCCRSSASQLNYETVEIPEIEEWVRRFVDALGITGQVSFDFIRGEDGGYYAIECNPRTHSAITMFYDHPGVAAAYLEDGAAPIAPLPTSRPTYWLYNEVWKAVRHPREAASVLRTIRRGKEAIFDWEDPLPFLMVHHAQIPSLLWGNLRRGAPWLKIDFNIGKLVEPAGD
jgi:predicted ATP-grasp superfamily ATP-dependent carboligase